MIESNRRFNELRANYAHSLVRKHQALTEAWRSFVADPGTDGLRRELHLLIHRLSGSALAYGYERLGTLARTADNLMRGEDERVPAARGATASGVDQLTAPIKAVLDELVACAQANATDPNIRDRTLRVLLVEDDPGQAILTGAQLEARGCAIRFESGGERLWQALAIWPCHAVVLDYWLRGDTAAEIAAMLRRDPQFAHIALICFSVERDEQVLRAALDAGCDAALGKAEGTDRLLALIRDCVARPDRSGRPFG